MDLKTGEVIKVLDGKYEGIYRLLAQNPNVIVLGIIEAPADLITKPGPKKLVYNEKGNLVIRNTTEVLALERPVFIQIQKDHSIHLTKEYEISNEAKIYGDKKSKNWERNVEAMKFFLDPLLREESILERQGLHELILKTLRLNIVSKDAVYRLVKRMILYGFRREALIPESYKAGTSEFGIYNPNKKKPGRKPFLHHFELINNRPPPVVGLPMSKTWQKMILNGIAKLEVPLPKFETVYSSILRTEFRVRTVGPKGEKIELFPAEGRYPTRRQMRYFLKKFYSKKGYPAFFTTPSNRAQNKRGTLSRSYNDQMGPGHTYAIDSTIADVYLVHHRDRTKVIGRPIVYVVIDVWSSAIVGFYVCLSGPHWDSAKMALFCTAYDPEKLAKLRGTEYIPTFKIKPTIPKILLSDRGEYLSQKAGYTSFLLHMDQDLTAPYRGDWKGIVEVQFHTIKDEQLAFVPGAHDARRQERELRKSHPEEAALSMKEFIKRLESCFRQYNRTPLQEHRIPESMKLHNIHFTPASLWDWGHANHNGSGIELSDDELIEQLLPKQDCGVKPSGISLNGRDYGDIDCHRDNFLTETAKHGIKVNVQCWSFPGNIDYIWTTDNRETGLRQVPIHSGNFTFYTEEEYADVKAILKANKDKFKHEETEMKVNEFGLRQEINAAAISETKAQLSNNPRRGKLNISQNRQDELAQTQASTPSPEVQSEQSRIPAYIQSQNMVESQQNSHSKHFKDILFGDDDDN